MAMPFADPLATASNRRAHTRHPVMPVKFALVQAEGRAYECVVEDVSHEGARLRFHDQVPSGRDLDILSSTTAPLSGRLLWRRDNVVGLRFGEAADSAPFLTACLDETADIDGRWSPRRALLVLGLASSLVWIGIIAAFAV